MEDDALQQLEAVLEGRVRERAAPLCAEDGLSDVGKEPEAAQSDQHEQRQAHGEEGPDVIARKIGVADDALGARGVELHVCHEDGRHHLPG